MVSFLAHHKCAGSTQWSYKDLISGSQVTKTKETLRNVKLYKQMKKSAFYNSNYRKTMSEVYSRAATPPATFKQRKTITRRNSWPPVAPLKLTKRRKYHELIKVKDFQEPFWMDTFDWLTMKCAPEKFKIAPLAKLSELEEYEATIIDYKNISYKPVASDSWQKSLANKAHLAHYGNELSFYFILRAKQKQIIEKKKYLQNLKSKCFITSICSVKPTNFDLLAEDDKKSVSNKNVVDRSETVRTFNIGNEIREATVNVNENYSPNSVSVIDVNESSFDNPGAFPPQRTQRSFIPIFRPVRPLRSYNGSDSNGGVLTCSVMPDLDMHCLKQKTLAKDCFKNKENIKVSHFNFPNAKYPEHLEKYNKKYSIGLPAKKIQKGSSNNESVKNRNKLPDKFIFNDSVAIEKEMHVIPKDISIKNNQQDITTYDPQDMMDPNTPESKKTESEPKASSDSSESSKTPITETSVTDSNVGSSSSSSGQRNKPYLRQLFGQDIQSNFALSSKVTKSTKNEKKESEVSGIQTDKSGKESQSSQQSDDSKTKETESSGQSDNVKTETDKNAEESKSSNQSCNLKTEIDKNEKGATATEQAKKQEIPACVIGQAFLGTLIEQTKTSSSDPCIPASVIGQSFLKTLVEQTPLAKEKPIPAEVIGQSFLKNLLDTQHIPEKSSGSHESESFAEKPIVPSSVLSQTFLKSLIENQSDVTPDNSSSLPSDSDNPELIPASIIGQQFLKALIQDVNESEYKVSEQEGVTSPAVSQSYLKSSTEVQSTEQESQPQTAIPASVVGQMFLKNLIEVQSPVTADSCHSKATSTTVINQSPGESYSAQCKIDDKGKDPSVIPASVVGQTFLKSLSDEAACLSESKPEATIPSSVLAQAFLKSLIISDQETDSNLPINISKCKSDEKSSIPAPVVAQTFLKTLTTEMSEFPSAGTVTPAPVADQTFVKPLTAQMSDSLTSETSVSASVIGQTFLKALLQDCETQHQEKENQNLIPSSVVGQAFLKTLVSQASDIKDEPKESAIPSSVTGQEFSKTLIGQAPGNIEETKETVIPSTVIGHAFLKTLVEQAPKIPVENKEQIIPSTVVGQTFLKTLIEKAPKAEEISEESVIPSSVVGQAFLKTLLDQKSETAKEPTCIPSTVLGQAFLKTLIEQAPQEVPKEPVVPSFVVGQTFLKTLIEKTSENQELPKKPVVPSSVIGQSFLKTLVEQTEIEEKTTEAIIPSSVVGQAFLKTLLEQAPPPSKEAPGKEPVIPSVIVGQAFLKTLLTQTPEIQETPTCSTPFKHSSEQTEQTKPISEIVPGSGNETKAKTVPANVVGQAFLKTLYSMSNQGSFGNGSGITSKEIEKSDCKDQHCLNQQESSENCGEVAFIDEQSSIIPPPPEFSGESEGAQGSSASGSSQTPDISKEEVPVNIIEELLSCTKIMESVLENLKEAEPFQSDADTHSDALDHFSK